MIDAALREALTGRFGDRVELDAPLARHTSLRVGGPADALVTPRDRDDLRTLLAFASEHGLPVHVLGGGFNTLVREGGLPGLVIRLRKLRAVERRSEDTLHIEAGASHATITRFCVERGLAGLEFGCGIPGTLGGWIRMNAGIGSREMCDVVREVEWLRSDGSEGEALSREALRFRYRGLDGLPPGAVIVAATLEVSISTREAVKAEVDRLLAHRAATQPLDVPSCGSVFRNPEGDYAGRLIEAAGLKGLRVGGAEISKVHANFIVNRGGATADDVLALIESARQKVLETSGVALETEVKIEGVAAGSEADGD